MMHALAHACIMQYKIEDTYLKIVAISIQIINIASQQQGVVVCFDYVLLDWMKVRDGSTKLHVLHQLFLADICHRHSSTCLGC